LGAATTFVLDLNLVQLSWKTLVTVFNRPEQPVPYFHPESSKNSPCKNISDGNNIA